MVMATTRIGLWQPYTRSVVLAAATFFRYHDGATVYLCALRGKKSFCCKPTEALLLASPGRRRGSFICRAAATEPLDLTEENVERVLLDARSELLQVFDTSVGITGIAELADLDGPFLKLRLKGRFWHQRSVVLARLANYLQKRIPEIVEVGIEDDSQLDDSPANFGHS